MKPPLAGAGRALITLSSAGQPFEFCLGINFDGQAT